MSNQMSILSLKNGQKAKVTKIDGGKSLLSHLISMGLLPGTTITAISINAHGPSIISYDNIRIGIGHGMARQIFVSLI